MCIYVYVMSMLVWLCAFVCLRACDSVCAYVYVSECVWCLSARTCVCVVIYVYWYLLCVHVHGSECVYAFVCVRACSCG